MADILLEKNYELMVHALFLEQLCSLSLQQHLQMVSSLEGSLVLLLEDTQVPLLLLQCLSHSAMHLLQLLSFGLLHSLQLHLVASTQLTHLYLELLVLLFCAH